MPAIVECEKCGAKNPFFQEMTREFFHSAGRGTIKGDQVCNSCKKPFIADVDRCKWED